MQTPLQTGQTPMQTPCAHRPHTPMAFAPPWEGARLTTHAAEHRRENTDDGPAMVETGWIIDGEPEALWSWPAQDSEEGD